MAIRTKLNSRCKRSIWMALAAAASLSGAALATADLRDDLWLRIEDARGVAGGDVTVVLRTESAFALGSGRLVFHAALANGTGGAGTPFSTCGSAIVFSGANDALLSNQNFDAGTQQYTLDFSSPSGTVNATAGAVAAVFCKVAANAVKDDEFTLDFVLGAGNTALADASGVALPVDPRSGGLRVRDALDASLDAEDTDVKPGATAQVEIETDYAFAIESGGVDLELDPALVAGTPSVAPVANHGAVSIDSQSWDAPTGRFRFTFSSPGAALNSQVPGALFVVSVPTVADDTLLGQTTPLVLIGADTFLVGPGASAIPLETKDGVLSFVVNVETEHVYEDGFSGGSDDGWSHVESESGH
jgi:hypothetical protein